MADPKPCPFCGGEVKLTPFGNELTKKCAVELRQEAFRYTLDWLRPKVVEMWNRRALPASVRALVEAASPIAAELGTIEQIDALRRDDGGARPWPTNRSLTDLEARAFLLALSAVLAEFPELKEDDRG